MSASYVRNPKLVAADMSGETVLMSIDTGQYYGLSDVGSKIWELLAHPVTLDTIVQQLRTTYEIDESQCRADATAFLDSLVAAGLARTA